MALAFPNVSVTSPLDASRRLAAQTATRSCSIWSDTVLPESISCLATNAIPQGQQVFHHGFDAAVAPGREGIVEPSVQVVERGVGRGPLGVRFEDMSPKLRGMFFGFVEGFGEKN